MSDIKIDHYTGLDHTPAVAFACAAHAELLADEGSEQAVALHWSYNAILATQDGKPIGVIVWFEQKESKGLWLQLGYVAREHRGKGVYSRLWAELVGKAVELKAPYIRSATRIDNEAMRAVARAQGRKEIAVSLSFSVPAPKEEDAA